MGAFWTVLFYPKCVCRTAKHTVVLYWSILFSTLCLDLKIGRRRRRSAIKRLILHWKIARSYNPYVTAKRPTCKTWNIFRTHNVPAMITSTWNEIFSGIAQPTISYSKLLFVIAVTCSDRKRRYAYFLWLTVRARARLMWSRLAMLTSTTADRTLPTPRWPTLDVSQDSICASNTALFQ
jgi:hypothetical protein